MKLEDRLEEAQENLEKAQAKYEGLVKQAQEAIQNSRENVIAKEAIVRYLKSLQEDNENC